MIDPGTFSERLGRPGFLNGATGMWLMYGASNACVPCYRNPGYFTAIPSSKSDDMPDHLVVPEIESFH
jgi:hypothetical protein